MLILNPASVRFGDSLWDDVSLVAIDRAATRLVEEWSDAGPYAVFIDCPEQRVAVRIVRRLMRDEPVPPALGTSGQLRMVTSPGASDAGRSTIEMTAVLTSVAHQVPGEPSAKASAVAQQTLSFLAVSIDGEENPVSITPAAGIVP